MRAVGVFVWCLLFVVMCSSLFGARCSLCVVCWYARCVSRVVRCGCLLLFVVQYCVLSLFGVRCSLSVTCRRCWSLVVPGGSSIVVRCVLSVALCADDANLLFAVRCSLLVVGCNLWFVIRCVLWFAVRRLLLRVGHDVCGWWGFGVVYCVLV